MERANGKKLQIPRNVINLKACTLSIKRQDKEHLHGKVEIFTMETMKTTNAKVTEKCIGQMAQFTKVSGEKVSSMAKES